jgi:hypothetical protein
MKTVDMNNGVKNKSKPLLVRVFPLLLLFQITLFWGGGGGLNFTKNLKGIKKRLIFLII